MPTFDDKDLAKLDDPTTSGSRDARSGGPRRGARFDCRGHQVECRPVMPAARTRVDSGAPAALGAALAASVSPTGALRIEPVDGAPHDGLSPAGRAALVAAAERGAGYAILHLGLDHPGASLSPSLGFARDVGKRLVGRLCAEPDLEALRDRVALEPAEGDLAALVEGAPPLVGAEYLDREVVGRLWAEAAGALRGAIQRHRGRVQDFLRGHGGAWNVVGRGLLPPGREPGRPGGAIRVPRHLRDRLRRRQGRRQARAAVARTGRVIRARRPRVAPVAAGAGPAGRREERAGRRAPRQ
jgi:hypothetical protein